MTAKKSTSAAPSPFGLALAEFRATEEKLAALITRRDELQAFAQSRDTLASHEAAMRTAALADADVAKAGEHDRRATDAAQAAQEARAELEMLREAIPLAEAAVIAGEEVIDRARCGALQAVVDAEWPVLLDSFRRGILRIYRAKEGQGNYTFALRVLLDDACKEIDFDQFAEIPEVASLPAPLVPVKSAYVSRGRRKELQGA